MPSNFSNCCDTLQESPEQNQRKSPETACFPLFSTFFLPQVGEVYEEIGTTSTHLAAQFMTPPGTPNWQNTTTAAANMQSQQGVLWKRRDVFKKSWRPRWFVLQSQPARTAASSSGVPVLTYYLLTSSSISPSTAVRENALLRTPTTAANLRTPPLRAVSGSSGIVSGLPLSPRQERQRDRTSSWDSAVSEQSVDYDVVPRGVIDLRGCTIVRNDALSKPAEQFYAFTIRPASASSSSSSPATAATGSTATTTISTTIHLAARSEESRAAWIRALQQAAASASNTAARRAVSFTNGGSVAPRSRGGQSFDESNAGSSSLLNGASAPMRNRLEHCGPKNDSPSSPSWRGFASTLCYANLPDDLSTQIRSLLDKYLTMLCEDNEEDNYIDQSTITSCTRMMSKNPCWKLLYCHENDAAAWIRNDTNNTLQNSSLSPLIRSVAFLPYSPIVILRLLIDPEFSSWESNRQSTRRVKTFNAHTFMDTYIYQQPTENSSKTAAAMPPSSPTTLAFSAVGHWQVVGKQHSGSTERAIVCVLFSYAGYPVPPLFPPDDENSSLVIHGKLQVSLYLLEPMTMDVDASGTTTNGCRVTRFVAMDWTTNATTVDETVAHEAFLRQQANLPMAMKEFLTKKVQEEPDFNSLVHHPIQDQLLSNDNVLEALKMMMIMGNGTAITDASEDGSTEGEEDEKISGKATPGLSVDDEITMPLGSRNKGDDKESMNQRLKDPTWTRQLLLLLTPLLSHTIFVGLFGFSGGLSLMVFLITAFWAVRQVVLLHILVPNEGRAFSSWVVNSNNSQETPLLVGPVVCRFTVDCKGITRFIANAQEERTELCKEDHEDITVVHLVASAVAKAFTAQQKEFVYRQQQKRKTRTCIPWLLIDENVAVMDSSFESSSSESPFPVNVSISDTASDGADDFITLEGVDGRSVQSVADELTRRQRSKQDDESRLKDNDEIVGHCLVLAPTNFDSNIDADMNVWVTTLPSDVSVLAVVGGFHHEHYHRHGISEQDGQSTQVLSVSLNMAVPNIAASQQYASEVKKLLQFPEMCDGMILKHDDGEQNGTT